MVKLEPIVKKYYDGLEEGKLLGRKCLECGAVEFPPVLACNTCSCTDMEWVELSGRAMMTDVILPGAVTGKPQNESLMPYAYCCVQMEEGPELNALCLGISKKNKPEIMKKLPVAVNAKIIQREGYKTFVFEYTED